jgi:hypothetical protein
MYPCHLYVVVDAAPVLRHGLQLLCGQLLFPHCTQRNSLGGSSSYATCSINQQLKRIMSVQGHAVVIRVTGNGIWQCSCAYGLDMYDAAQALGWMPEQTRDIAAERIAGTSKGYAATLLFALARLLLFQLVAAAERPCLQGSVHRAHLLAYLQE